MDAKFVGDGGSIAQPDDFVKFSPRDAAEFTGDGDVKFSKRVTDKESKNVYKTHRILMPDGSAFEYKENAEPTPARGVAINGSYASPISSASASIVAENPEDVKFLMPDGSSFVYNNKEVTVGTRVYGDDTSAAPTIIRVTSESIVAENPEDVKFSPRPTDTPQFKRWFKGSKVTNGDGSPKILYHQTNADFTEFDVGRQGAGYSDNEMPSGIYYERIPGYD